MCSNVTYRYITRLFFTLSSQQGTAWHIMGSGRPKRPVDLLGWGRRRRGAGNVLNDHPRTQAVICVPISAVRNITVTL